MSFPAIIRDEMRLVDRPLPERLPNCVFGDEIIQLARDAFLFTTPRGTRFHYQRGLGIAVDKSITGSDEETDLFYNGTVYGGVAWLNGLVPLHASSVVGKGKVIAFTGDSGEGKSTIAAALTRHGFSHRSDDVLLVQAQEGSVIAFVPVRGPGQRTPAPMARASCSRANCRIARLCARGFRLRQQAAATKLFMQPPSPILVMIATG